VSTYNLLLGGELKSRQRGPGRSEKSHLTVSKAIAFESSKSARKMLEQSQMQKSFLLFMFAYKYFIIFPISAVFIYIIASIFKFKNIDYWPLLAALLPGAAFSIVFFLSTIPYIINISMFYLPHHPFSLVLVFVGFLIWYTVLCPAVIITPIASVISIVKARQSREKLLNKWIRLTIILIIISVYVYSFLYSMPTLLEFDKST
jgi:hypothetical protein